MIAMLAAAVLAASVPFRGVVEGYYGRPWGTEGRISLMKFMGERDLNTFIYGPKDDPYHHAKWREAYPEEQMADFARLLKCAKENKINFYWAIHLGGGFRKGSEEDFQALFKKFGWMYDIGVRSFAVFFDDFGGADAEFHAEICNRIVKDFLEVKKDCSPLVMCPNVYWGSNHPYHKTLGAKLDKRVNIMWTGRSICTDIRAEDVQRITENFQRPPFIWWNWPVNDYCRKHVLLGRTYGIDDCEYSGVVLNPMENCEANKIALHGFAEWCRDPKSFDSKKVWEESFAKIYKDPEVAKAMRIFAEHNSDQGPTCHGYRREESVSAIDLCDRALAEFKKDGCLEKATIGELNKLFKSVEKACKTLLERLPKENPQLLWELQGWIENEMYLMQEGRYTLLLLQGEKASKANPVARLRKIREKMAESTKAHQEKFRQATFANDRGWINPPIASSRVLTPMVEEIMTGVLKARFEKRTGAKFDSAQGFAAFSTAESLPKLTVSRNGKYAGLDRGLELKEIKPGEMFGIKVPKDWKTNYFHAKLENQEAATAGVIEVSKDGSTWEKLNTRNHDGQMETQFNANAGWRQARYRNASDKTVTVKLTQFKFDVEGEDSPIDALLKEEK